MTQLKWFALIQGGESFEEIQATDCLFQLCILPKVLKLHLFMLSIWKQVFLCINKPGFFPHKKSVGTEGTEEERRVVFVGLTRAKYRLMISCTKGWSPLVKKLIETKPYITTIAPDKDSEDIDYKELGKFLDRSVVVKPVTPPESNGVGDREEKRGVVGDALGVVTPETSRKRSRFFQ
jgi:hypothetical protein